MQFHRTYLSSQVADKLAAEIRNGAWRDSLPGERKLADMFGVSRKTIRAALVILVRIKTLRTHRGRHIIVSRSVRGGGEPRKRVCLITGNYRADMQLFPRLEHVFTSSCYDLQMEMMPSRGSFGRWLEEITGRGGISAWILCSVSKEVQAWFERRGLPALILGSRHDGINLPDLDVDYRAVCRHAAGTLLRLGHRRIIFLNLESDFAGDLAGEQGFLEAFAGVANGPECSRRILRHKGGRTQFCRLIERLFGEAFRPTAMLVSGEGYMATAMWRLARLGLKIPQDVSVICRDDDPLFEYFMPSPACYRVDFDRFARRAVQLAVQLDQGVSLSPNSLRLMPRFIAGETIAGFR